MSLVCFSRLNHTVGFQCDCFTSSKSSSLRNNDLHCIIRVSHALLSVSLHGLNLTSLPVMTMLPLLRGVRVSSSWIHQDGGWGLHY